MHIFVSARGSVLGFLLELNCAPTVHESNVLILLGLAWSEKQIPDLLETLAVRSKRKEPLESGSVRPRHVERSLSRHPLIEVKFTSDKGRYKITKVGNNLGTITAEYPHKP